MPGVALGRAGEPGPPAALGRREPQQDEEERRQGDQGLGAQPGPLRPAAGDHPGVVQVVGDQGRTDAGHGRDRQAGAGTPAGQPGGEQQGRAQGERDHEPAWPPRQVGHGPRQHPLVDPVGVEETPVAADGPFLLALPGLVEGLDQVVAPALGLGHAHEAAHEPGLVDPARHGGLALAPLARPAGLPNQDWPPGECRRHPLPHPPHLLQGLVDPVGLVFPVGEQVDGQEVDLRRDLGVPEPELPDVGVGDRLPHARLDPAHQLRHLHPGALAPEQHLVADDDRADHVGVAAGELHHPLDLLRRDLRVDPDPGPEHHLQPVRPGDLGDDLEPDHGVGAHAAEVAGQEPEVPLHLLPGDDEGRAQGRLVAGEGGVGDALHPAASGNRLLDRHRASEPVPRSGQGQDGQRDAHGVPEPAGPGRACRRRVGAHRAGTLRGWQAGLRGTCQQGTTARASKAAYGRFTSPLPAPLPDHHADLFTASQPCRARATSRARPAASSV
jgi:hypothetical protein